MRRIAALCLVCLTPAIYAGRSNSLMDVSPDGTRTSEDDAIELCTVSAEGLAAEAERRAG